MPRLLHLDSSADLTTSTSRAVTAAFAAAWRALGDDHTMTYRDLHRDPLPHLADAALHWHPATRPDDAVPADAAALQQELIDELFAADVVLVGSPLYNYSMPSTLKAWVDHVHVPGLTSAAPGEAPPMAGRPAVVVASRGLAYDASSPLAGSDHGTAVLELVLGEALGMDVEVITADLTLAASVPALADQAERGRAERERAITAAQDAARRLGRA